MARYLQRLSTRLSLKLAISSIVVTGLIIIISAILVITLVSANQATQRSAQTEQAIASSTKLAFALNNTIDASQRLQRLDQPSGSDLVDYYAARKPLLDAQHELQMLASTRPSADWDKLDANINQLTPVLDQIGNTGLTDVVKARDLWNTTAFDLSNQAKAEASAFNDAVLHDAADLRQSSATSQLLAAIVLVGLSLLAVLISILFGVLNNAVFVRPIRNIEYELKRIAAGDLTHQLRVENNDELGDLVRTFNQTVADLRGLITELKHQTGDIEGASAQVSAISSQQLVGSQQQVQALTNATSLIAELKDAAASIDGSAVMVATAARQALSSAATGSDSITANIRSMQQIQEKVININAHVQALNEGLTQVERILEIMDELTTDSKLLSLNALIEASGAGPHSRRFIVVANEMSNLAERSREATKEVQEIIASVQAAMRNSLDATTVGLQEVERSTELSRRSEVATRQIVDAVSHTARLADHIMSSTSRQHDASEQAATTIQAINQVAAANLNTSDKAASTASRLTVIATQLRDAAGSFEVQ